MNLVLIVVVWPLAIIFHVVRKRRKVAKFDQLLDMSLISKPDPPLSLVDSQTN